MVDFESIALHKASLAFTAPGQVQAFNSIGVHYSFC